MYRSRLSCSFVESCNFTIKVNSSTFEVVIHTRHKLCHYAGLTSGRSLSTDVFEPRTSTGSLCFSFSTFSCPTNELPSSHFSIYNLIFSTKSELYAPKRRSFDFRLTSVAEKRLCLSSLLTC